MGRRYVLGIANHLRCVFLCPRLMQAAAAAGYCFQALLIEGYVYLYRPPCVSFAYVVGKAMPHHTKFNNYSC